VRREHANTRVSARCEWWYGGSDERTQPWASGLVRDANLAWREISRQELVALQNILTDLFRGEVVDNVALSVRSPAPPVVCG
jgi:hypothetical protein